MKVEFTHMEDTEGGFADTNTHCVFSVTTRIPFKLNQNQALLTLEDEEGMMHILSIKLMSLMYFITIMADSIMHVCCRYKGRIQRFRLFQLKSNSLSRHSLQLAVMCFYLWIFEQKHQKSSINDTVRVSFDSIFYSKDSMAF